MMTNKFPLYDRLEKNIPKKDLTPVKKKEFINKIINIDNTGKDLIFALVKFHAILNNDTDYIPYNGFLDGNNISWSFNNFPIKLKHILYKFIIMHTETMKEENDREKLIL